MSAAASQQSLDDYGFFGPIYSFADNIPLPSVLGCSLKRNIDVSIILADGADMRDRRPDNLVRWRWEGGHSSVRARDQSSEGY